MLGKGKLVLWDVNCNHSDLASKLPFHVCADLLSAAVHPYNCIMQGLAAGFVPDNSGFPLVGDANALYIQLSMLFLCCPYSLLYTLLNSLPYFLRIVLYPAAGSQHG